MEDHRLRAFCLIVEMGSFSKAAEVKFLTQSAMSHLIKNLEDDLGTRLLIRRGKNVVPTSAGSVFYEHAKRILGAYKEMEDDLYHLVSKIKGTLSIGASAAAATYLLPQVFYDFSRSYSEARLQLSISNTDKIIHELHQGKIDLGIIEGDIKDGKISFQEIADDEIVLIASDDNPLTRKTAIAPKDVISQPFIMPEAGSGTREIIDDFLRTLKIDLQELKIIMTLGDPELLVRMVQSGLGIAFVSKWSIFKTVKEGSIRIVSVSGKKLYRKIYLISLEKEPATLVARTFKKFVHGYRFFIPF
jgi:LysR family transcriptional regulator, transcriptional activator of the cysJI operon